MGYFGSKATTGLSQALIALMPRHSVYIESHLGGGALMKRKPAAMRSIGIDRDERALDPGWHFLCSAVVYRFDMAQYFSLPIPTWHYIL